MIPYLVHQLWLDPDAPSGGVVGALPADVRRNVDAWKMHHPDLEHHVWTLPHLSELLRDVNGIDVLAAVSVCRFPTMQSNMIRLTLLWHFGGFWSDLKNLPQREVLRDLCSNDLVLCDHQPMPDAPPPGYLTNSFIGSIPRHPFIWTCLAEGVAGVERREGGSLSRVTGLVMMNRLYKRMVDAGTMWEHRHLSREEIWGEGRIKRTSISYQSGGRHWSQMQKTQSLYLDDDVQLQIGSA